MVKLTQELIEQCASYTNPVKDREMDLRGYKIPVIENLGATLDQFDTLDFSDNEIRKLDGFPILRRLKNIIINNNRVIRIGEHLEESLPALQSVILTNNNMQELGDLDVLSTVPTLEVLSLLGNPVSTKPHYRLYLINKIPQLRVLDFRKIKDKIMIFEKDNVQVVGNTTHKFQRAFLSIKERKAAKVLFKGKKGAALASDIGKRSKTFVPGGDLVGEQEAPSTQSKEDVEAIKRAIASATTLAEVERLQAMLQAGQIPGKQARNGLSGGGDTRQIVEMDE